MAFIRERTEERTGYQLSGFPTERSDNHVDFVMVYRMDESTEARIRFYKERGYVVHLMTGISWGHYTDYLDGEYDGVSHWDEGQTDRFGNMILHSPRVPYMVPTLSFTAYITEQLKKAVDLGVEAIHVEEPEFWDRAGYSEAFKREFALYYRKPWEAPHSSVDARYKCAKLKAYLFTRTIDRVSAELKAYAQIKYGRELRFYVPTHSLVNYTQWKIVSPEGRLADIPGVDGCIAQVWTGTSREKNWFEGKLKERTFETAFLEYGVMQELVKGTGRHMWFLHDPIEDNPAYDWNDYRLNYLRTVTASLLHPKINTYEICPWPNRVFEDKYPKTAPDPEPISEDYATLLNNMFNTLGTMEAGEEKGVKVGILTGDCELYQREYPDSEFSVAAKEEVGTVLIESQELADSFRNELFAGKGDKELMLRFMQSSTFPAFYSLALPLLKYGVNVRPVLLDNTRRYAGYLDDYDVLVMSYEFMKPDYPDINLSIAEWVSNGGTLIYVGDGFDPYNDVESWWTGKYKNPAEHLFRMLGITPEKEQEIFSVGAGKAGIWLTNPCRFSFSRENAEGFRAFVKEVVSYKYDLAFSNKLEIERAPYIISAVLDESISDEPAVYKGLFADMYTSDFAVITEKTVHPGGNTMLCDLTKITDDTAIIGSSVRICSLEHEDNTVTIGAIGAGRFTANIRVKLPFVPAAAVIDGEACEMSYNAESKTALLTFPSMADRKRKIEIKA